MSQQVIDELHRENLCTYFVLPLLKLNKSAFAAESNFIDSYLSRELDSIYVHVYEYLFFKQRMLSHPEFVQVYQMAAAFGVQYHIPIRWAPDLKLFAQGKYSRMSRAAKDHILQWGGMQYRVRIPPEMIPVTDVRLLALERSGSARRMWEEAYNVTLSEEDELLSLPTERLYIKIEELTLLTSL